MNSGQRRSSGESTPLTRARLLDATVDLIRTAGPKAATSRAIAGKANENLGAITYYFGSKEQLIAEAMGALARELIQPVIATLSDVEADPAQRLLTSAQLLHSILDENRHQLHGYVHSLAAAAAGEAGTNEVRELHRSLVVVIREAIHDQQHRRLLPDWIIPEPMAQVIVAVVNGVVVSAGIDPEQTDEAAVGAQFVQLLLAAQTSPKKGSK